MGADEDTRRIDYKILEESGFTRYFSHVRYLNGCYEVFFKIESRVKLDHYLILSTINRLQLCILEPWPS